MNSSFELNNPVIDFVPKKVDLGKRKLTSCLRDKIHNLNAMNSPNFFAENILGENKIKDEVLNKSTKLNKKRMVKVIDKIVKIKLNIDSEDDDNIRRNIIKLRKYCFELIRKKKKPKKTPKPKPISPQRLLKQRKDNTIKRSKVKNKKTLIKTHPSILSLFQFKENQENQQEPEITRKDTSKKIREYLNTNIIEKREKSNELEKNNFLSKSRKTYKLSSFEEMQSTKQKRKEKINLDKKRKIRRFQTLNMGNTPKDLIKNNENKKNDFKKENKLLIQINYPVKEPLIFSKFARPSKFAIVNNNKVYNKINSFFDNRSIKLKKDKNNVKYKEEIKEEDIKREYKVRKSFAKNTKNTVKVFSNGLNRLKIISDQM